MNKEERSLLKYNIRTSIFNAYKKVKDDLVAELLELGIVTRSSKKDIVLITQSCRIHIKYVKERIEEEWINYSKRML